jgi:hypothetical protein
VVPPSASHSEGHEVTFVCYTGLEDLNKGLPQSVDLVFIGSFTEAALLAYALSSRFRARGRTPHRLPRRSSSFAVQTSTRLLPGGRPAIPTPSRAATA